MKLIAFYIAVGGILGFNLSGFSQDFSNYQPLKQSGRFPQEFTKRSSEKFEEQLKQVDGKKRYERKAQEKFYLESNFVIDEMLHSGKILFNDPVTSYLNEVADKLLENDPALRKQIQFYTVRSSVVNAFATQNGLIFVTMGLLAQLENEAQLAYILSHEIMHYKLTHGINSAVNKEALRRGKKDYGKLSWDERLEAKSMFSKEQELESDIEGLKLFLSTNYGAQYILNTFDVLQYSYLPYNEVRLDHNFLGSEKLVFPDSYYLSEITAISEPDKLDKRFESTTHPNIGKRREVIAQELQKRKYRNGDAYLVSENTFERVRNISRFEILPLYVSNSEFEKALYHSFLLLQEFSDSEYVKVEAVKSLFMLTLYANQRKFSAVHTQHSKVEGESQQLYHVFHKMNAEELNVAALHFVDRALNQHPDNTELQRFRRLLTQELAFEHYTTKQKLVDVIEADEPKVKAVIESKEGPAELEVNDKYSKIRDKNRESLNSENAYLANVLREFMESSWFSPIVNDALENPRPEPFEPTFKQRKAYERYILKNGRKLGIDKVAIVNTMYQKIDDRKKNKVQYLAAEEAHTNYNKTLVEIGSKAGLQVEVIGGRAYKNDEADKLADQFQLQQWLTQRSQFGELVDIDYINIDSVQVSSLVAKYGTKYFAWTGRINYAERDQYLLYRVLGSIVVPYSAPLLLPGAFTPNHETMEIMLVFDITDGRLLMSHTDVFSAKDTKHLIRSHLYDQFYQMKRK
jgi:hypothetical protein